MTDFPFPRFAQRLEADPGAGGGLTPPIADFSSANLGSHAVQFTDLSTDLDGQVVAWEWDFGDGPSASFIFVINGLSVTFTDQSTDPGGAVVSWAWTFGDGTTSAVKNPTHTYPTSGSYTTTLTVTDTDGNTASASGVVTIVSTGRPFGPFTMWGQTVGVQAFTMSTDAISAGGIIARIDAARATGFHLHLAMTGGSHDQYKTNGVFDLVNGHITGMVNGVLVKSKWAKAMDLYNTPAIQKKVADAVADRTVLGNSVMDEPFNTTGANSWGPVGTITKPLLDEMAAYVSAIFPTLPIGVVTTPDWRTFESFTRMDYYVPQYEFDQGMGTPTAFRDLALSEAARQGMKVAFSMNILNGGERITNCPVGTVPGTTGGVGTFGPNCRMRADQILDASTVLGPAGAGLFLWRYDVAMMQQASYQAVFQTIANLMAGQPVMSWRRGG